MKQVLAAALAASLIAAEASATGTISCAAPAGSVSLDIAIGTVPGLAVVGARIEAEGQRWTLAEDGAPPIAVSQAFATGDQIWIDFTDRNVTRLVAEIRLFKTDEGRHAAMAGTLRMPNIGAWAVVCSGS